MRGEVVKVRRVDVPISICAPCVAAHLIAQDENDVGPIVGAQKV
jgi:hypothetical protein